MIGVKQWWILSQRVDLLDILGEDIASASGYNERQLRRWFADDTMGLFLAEA